MMIYKLLIRLVLGKFQLEGQQAAIVSQMLNVVQIAYAFSQNENCFQYSMDDDWEKEYKQKEQLFYLLNKALSKLEEVSK